MRICKSSQRFTGHLSFSRRNQYKSAQLRKLNIVLLANILLCVHVFSQGLPIKPGRTINITTDEGSRMDVDVSPDGRKLVFDLLGDLFLIPAKGGKAIQLTQGLALNCAPVWSPDSKKIAYISDVSGFFQLNIRDIGGRFHRVLGKRGDLIIPGQKPIWSPDGNYVAISGYIYGLAGGITALPEHVANPLQFPGRQNYYHFFVNGRLIRQDATDPRIYGNMERTSILPINRNVTTIEFAPNGHLFAFQADSNHKKGLFIRDLINNRERLLVTSLIPKYPNYSKYRQPRFSFSADSKSVFIGFGGKIHRLDVESGADKIIPFIAKIKTDMGPLNYNTFRVPKTNFTVKYSRNANASPDRKHIVFAALNKIYIKDLPSGKPHPLVNQSFAQYQPSFSPNGQWVAYVSWSDVEGGQVWRVPVNGGTPQKITSTSGHYERPTWSPDGKKIAVIHSELNYNDIGGTSLRDKPGTGKLEIISLDSGESKLIAEKIPAWNRLSFSIDGSRITYEPVIDLHPNGTLIPQLLVPQLVSKNIDGGQTKIESLWKRDFDLLGNSAYDSTVSPDCRFIVYSIREDLYLVPLLRKPAIVYDDPQQLSVIKFSAGLDATWEQGGKVLAWSYGHKFYRIDPEKIIAAAERKAKVLKTGIKEVSVRPDQVIDLSLTAEVHHAKGVIVLKNARIISMHGNRIIRNGTIIIRDGRIAQVGETSSLHVPINAKVIDCKTNTIMPGLIDMHLHMPVPASIFPGQSWMYLVNLAYGVTTARDPQTSYDAFGYSELLNTGQMIGPRLVNSGRPIRGNFYQLANFDEARSMVAKRKLLGAGFIKQYTLATRQEKQWLLMACEKAGMNMTNEGHVDPILQMGQLKDGSEGVEHSGEWGDLNKDLLIFLSKSGSYLTLTLGTEDASPLVQDFNNFNFWQPAPEKLRHFLPDFQFKTIVNSKPVDTTNMGYLTEPVIYARIQHAGGKITFGSHGDFQGTGVHNELWGLHIGGLTNMETLQAATINAAKGLGVQRDLGSLEVGKIADLIVLNSNPLDDIHNSRDIKYVMKDGILYDGDTLDEIWPIKKKCPEWKLKTTNDEK